MFGYSMKDEDFIKLFHFDRVRRGHYDKIPNILMLFGLSASIHILHANLASDTLLILAIGMFGIGIYLKQWFVKKLGTSGLIVQIGIIGFINGWKHLEIGYY